MRKLISDRYSGLAAAAISFVAAFGFFQSAYPYHLMYREQLTLFLYDADYISETYRGMGWLARFLGDFTDQFLYFPVLGPVLIALLLTATAAAAYGIFRTFLGKGPSLAIAAAVFVWAFFRETDNQFVTRYSIALLGYLALVLAALKFRRAWTKAGAAALLLAFGAWAFASPYHQHYGKLLGIPDMVTEKVEALDVEACRGHWDKVLKLAEKKDPRVNEASYFYNLAKAKQGQLGNDILKYSQNYGNGLFLWVSDQVSLFTNSIAGEVWYQLGDMTLAEQSAIVSLQASPKHTGARYFVRLAQITLINGEYAAAQKYLTMLGKTLNYRRWALKMMPENHTPATTAWLEDARSKLTKSDIVYGKNDFRPILRGLLAANPGNAMAREYLLCYDLMFFDLESFMDDYSGHMISGNIYQEATLIWLNIHGMTSDADARRFGVSGQMLDRMEQFYSYPDRYKDTYWYYYSTAQ